MSSNIIYAEEQYFNPQFLGKDASLVQDLTFLNNGNDITPGNYYLDLYVGDKFIKNININFYNKDSQVVACIDGEMAELLPLNKVTRELIKQLPSVDGCLDLKTVIPEVDYNIDLPKLAFKIIIPQIYLESKATNLARESDWDSGITAALINYNFVGTNSHNENGGDYSSYYFYLNNKLNIGAWRLYGNMYWNENKFGNLKNSEFKSNGIYLARDIKPLKSTLLIGQNSLGSNLFDAIQYIGLTIASSNEMRPENENGYAPPIRGVASTRSKITVRQNNLIVYQTFIDPGPYDIKDLYPVGSSGDYEVELTSLDGAVVGKYNVPYSTLPNLLKEKNYNYSATLGQLDLPSVKEYKFLQGSFSYGLPFRATLYGGVQGYTNYQSLGLGVAKDFGHLGALSVDMVNSDTKFTNESYRINGQSYRILFAKSFVGTKTNIQLTGYRYSTSGFYTLNEAVYKNSNIIGNSFDDNLLGRKRSTFQANISQNLGNWGQLYLWGTTSKYWGKNESSNNIQVGWNKTFSQLNGLMVSFNYNKQKFNGIDNNSIGLSLMMPLNFSKKWKSNSYISNNSIYNKSTDQFVNNTNVYGRTDDNKLNYSVFQSVTDNSSSDTTNLNLKYDVNIADLTLGASYSKSTKQINYGISGSVLLHDDAISFFKQAYDTNILVEAKGATGAEFSKAGDNIKINKQGYALIPYATPYRYNDVELNPETFKDGYDIDNKILKTAPTRGAIAKVIFDVRKGYNFIIRPNLNGEIIKFGTVVESLSDNSTSIANDDGTVYISGVKNNSKYRIYWNKDHICEFTVHYDENFREDYINKKNVTCEVVSDE